ncbi:MAG TPA: adenylate/guanylate cyclase domain-containing protein, partial [Actinomycetota bacterium]|nr:adenylate/guanylate cyclase domain-containing protein [Actinomycetota bacterium]
WAEAEQEARRALTELGSFNVMFAGEGFYEVGEVRLRMGDLEGAETAFRQAQELGRTPHPGLALLRLAEGKIDSAQKAIGRAVEEASDVPRIRLLPGQVEIAVAAGDLETARHAHAEMEKLRQTYDSKVFHAATLQAGGSIRYSEGDYSSAMKELRHSLRLWQEADLPYEAARVRLLLGVALQSAGDEDEAQFELQTAKKAFEKLGAQLDLRRALDLLGEEVSEKLAKASVPTQRLTRTFMFTDIVGSTNLAGVLGDDAWGHLLSWHDDAMRKLFATHNGEEVKQVGDGFFVAFERPHEAVECAVAIQKRLEEHRKETGFAPQVRIGLHCADAARRGRDYEGMGVHEAARVGALAQAGEILASREVVEAALIRFPVSPYRSVELKGVPHPVDVASISVS